MSFKESIANINKELAIFKEQLTNYNAHKQILDDAQKAYLAYEAGSVEYLNNQKAYHALLGFPIPLPRNQWLATQATPPPPPPARKRRPVPKKISSNNIANRSPPAIIAPNSNTRVHNAAKHKIIQDAILATFKFKTVAECSGRKFITRQELVDAIKANNVLSTHVGDIRKNITKEEICNKLFSKPK
jgi:hypothetical protein